MKLIETKNEIINPNRIENECIVKESGSGKTRARRKDGAITIINRERK